MLIAGGLRLATRVVTLLAILLILLESFSFLTLYLVSLRDRYRSLPAQTNSAYHNVPWADTYWREQKQHLSQGYESYPDGLWRLRAFAGKTIMVDARGIRRTENSQCEGDVPAIYIFGGSTVWGQGSPDWETIPSHLARLFSISGQPRCVINMGNDAWRSDESLKKLIRELKNPRARRPHHVLFLDSCNDTYTPFMYTGQVDLPWNFNKTWLDALAVRQTGSFRYLGITNTLTLVQRLMGVGRLLPMPPDPDRVAREIVENYLNNMRIVDGLSRSYGFRYDFFWLPLAIDEKDTPIFRVPVEVTLPLIRKSAGGRLHDLSGIFDGQVPKLSIDTCHLLPEGNRLLADRVYEIIK